MNKDLFRIPLLLIGVIVILIGLRFMPTFTILGYEVKAIDPYYNTAEYLVDGYWYYNLSSLTNGVEMFCGWSHLRNFDAQTYSL